MLSMGSLRGATSFRKIRLTANGQQEPEGDNIRVVCCRFSLQDNHSNYLKKDLLDLEGM